MTGERADPLIYLSDKERKALAEWSPLYNHGFTIEEVKRLRFARWLIEHGRLTERL